MKRIAEFSTEVLPNVNSSMAVVHNDGEGCSCTMQRSASPSPKARKSFVIYSNMQPKKGCSRSKELHRTTSKNFAPFSPHFGTNLS